MHREDHTFRDLVRENRPLPPEAHEQPDRMMDAIALEAPALRDPIEAEPDVSVPGLVDDFEYDTQDLDGEILDPVDLDEVLP